MHLFAKSCSFVLALNLLAGTAIAAVATPDRGESVTVTGQQPALTLMNGDLDPLKDHFDGLTGEKIARTIDRVDRYDAFRVFAQGLSGPLGESYDWHGLRDDGNFRPTREFTEAGLLCRDFAAETDHHGGQDTLSPASSIDYSQSVILGTACREGDGWHFR